jgi:putative transposase
MTTKTISYQRHRFPSEIISHAVWLYHGFCLSFREVEELLAERGITVTYETVRQWCQKFGPAYTRKLKKRQGRLGDTWHIDEVFVTIQGERHYLWRAVDQDGDTIDILVQRRRNKQAAVRFLRRLIKGQGGEPRWLVTDKLRSYDAAHRTVMPTVSHINHVYANNRAEVSHQPTRQQEYHMRGFSSSTHAQRFLTLHGLTQNLFRLGRHLMQAVNYRIWRTQSFQIGKASVCA